MKLKQIVAYTNRGGLWKIIAKRRPLLNDCQRYTIQNINTDEILDQVRDKDLITREMPYFFDYVQANS